MVIFGFSDLESLGGKKGIIAMLLHIATSFYASVNSATIMTLMFYFSKIACIEINQMSEQVTRGNVRMNQVGEKMLFIKSKIDEMNSHLGIAVLLNFFIGGLTLSMGVCLIAEHLGKRIIKM